MDRVWGVLIAVLGSMILVIAGVLAHGPLQ